MFFVYMDIYECHCIQVCFVLTAFNTTCNKNDSAVQCIYVLFKKL